jgi:hypothetical protein
MDNFHFKVSFVQRSLVFLLIAVVLTVALPAKCIADGSLSDKEFFASLNLQREGLESVRNALLTGDTTAAKHNLHTYFLERSGVHYFDLSTGGDILEADDNLNNYFTVVGIRLLANLENNAVDWNISYSPDHEWHWQFHRMSWLINYARVYQKTGNEKYAQGWIDNLTDWAGNNAPGYPRTLDTGNRLRNWVESYQYMVHLLKTPSLKADEHMVILKSLIQQARFLKDNWKADSNWGASETRGLNEVVVMFPEFNFYPEGTRDEWIQLIQERLLYHLKQNFLADGVQFETSPMYHYLTYRNLLIAFQLMTINDIPASSEFDSLFILPAEFMMHITKPDGNIPQLADSDKTNRHLHYLTIAGEAFNREDFLFVASGGAKGQMPTETFMAFPDGKNIVMRSSWGGHTEPMKDARYMVFNYSSNQPWHAHFDMLSFDAYAYGRGLIIDPGRYTYGEDDGWRNYFKNTAAHNTIVVNGNNQVAYAGASAEWLSMPEFDYINAFHDAYTIRQQQVRHRRKVFFVKPDYWVIADVLTGNGSHKLDLYFHVDPALKSGLVFSPESQILSTQNFKLLPSNTLAEASIENGWVSFEYGKKVEAPVLKYNKNGFLPQTFENILYPFASGNPHISIEQIGSSDAAGYVLPNDKAVMLKTNMSDFVDYIGMNHSLDEIIISGEIAYAGEAIHIRVENDGDIQQYGLIQTMSIDYNGRIIFNSDNNPLNVSYKGTELHVEGHGIEGFMAYAPGVTVLRINGGQAAFIQNEGYIYYGTFITRSTYPEYLPENMKLEQNYPNPFSSSTFIAFYLQENTHVNLALYDLSGRKIRSLIDEPMLKGKQSIEFTNTSLTSGAYFYSLKTAFGTAVKKMIVVSASVSH